nr:LOW QUALITY PROTEIN: TIR domain-containing adapter molecule 1-like [Nerophis lumbriciformis]
MNREERYEGTGLKDVYDILTSVPPEQILSLTFQLEESPEDNIIHALCLIILRKEEKALDILHTLENNDLARHLAEIWRKSGCKLQDFAELCGKSPDLTGESLAALARVFKILSEHRLCDQLLRNQAYKIALSSHGERSDDGEDLLYQQLKEEAKNVCGPQLAVWLGSFKNLESGSYDETQADGATTQDPCLSSLLPSSCSEPSYPSHLEISLPSTIPYEEDQTTPEAPGNPEQIPNDCQSNTSEQSHLLSVELQPTSDESPEAEEPKMDTALETEQGKHQEQELTQTEPCNQSTTQKTQFSTNYTPTKKTETLRAHLSKRVEEEDEAIFYSFVIFHAVEDSELAERMKEKLETVIGEGQGATFFGDFELPGMSTLKCIEDAINNSAFTVLLLTRNFNTRMLEVKTDSALTNSISNLHKYNTVIPLLPKENGMPRRDLPMVLRTFVPLEENKSFETKIKKALSPAKINRQRSIWSEERRTHQRGLPQGRVAHMLENLNFKGSVDFSNAASVLEPHRNIHIANANYVMIGNDSQMTVDYCGVAERDPIVRENRE